MRVCQRCLYGEYHPLGIVIAADGICSGCRVHEEKDVLDWSARRQKLGALLDRYRGKSSSRFDCVVPVSGARDSYFIVHVLKREFGMNPLLVNYNKFWNTSTGHRNLAYLRSIFDADFYSYLPNRKLVQNIVRRTLDLRGSIYWHVIAGQTVLPVQVAVRYKIPLVIWGHHQGLDQVGMYSHTDEVEMSRKYRKNHDLMGLEAEDIVSEADGLPERDLRPWYYPHDKDIQAVGVRGIYLGNYIRWDSKAQHESMIERYGYESLPQQRTFDSYNDADCVHYSGLHDAIKFWKFGYGKVIDHASREIRLRRMTRDEGLAMARCYAAVEPEDTGLLLDWLALSQAELITKVDAHRDPRVWQRGESGAWHLRHPMLDGAAPDPAAALTLTERWSDFRATTPREGGEDGKAYVTLHRGYVDGHPIPDVDRVY